MIETRRLSRGLALQMLYEIDCAAHDPADVIALYAPVDLMDPHVRLLGYLILWAQQYHEPKVEPFDVTMLTAQPLKEQISMYEEGMLSLLSNGQIDELLEEEAEDVYLQRQVLVPAFEEEDALRIATIKADVLASKEQEVAHRIAKGVYESRSSLDDLIQRFAPEWPVDQIAIIERNILRIAIYEFHIAKDVPVGAAINEAVELSKIFGAANTPSFVNGVLGSIVAHLKQEKVASKE